MTRRREQTLAIDKETINFEEPPSFIDYIDLVKPEKDHYIARQAMYDIMARRQEKNSILAKPLITATQANRNRNLHSEGYDLYKRLNGNITPTRDQMYVDTEASWDREYMEKLFNFPLLRNLFNAPVRNKEGETII